MSETTEKKTALLPIEKTIDEESTKIVKYIEEHFPQEVKQQMSEVVQILDEGKHLPQLYPEIIAEVPMSQSSFLDICVQMLDHFTPHRKLRQCMLELQGKLEALHTAKHGHRKAIIKVERLKLELERLKKRYEELKDKSDNLTEEELNELNEIELDLAELQVEYEEALDGLRSAQHMVKDAMLKVVQYRQLTERYKKEVEESGLSFEEAEMIYYVLYFTKDAEVQLRTMGRIDTGTFGAIAQLPEGLRKKVLSNIKFIRQKLAEGWDSDGDYIFQVYWNDMLPQKTGEGEFEGVNVKEFIAYTPPKIIAKTNLEEAEDLINEADKATEE